ncbi:MAG: tRNA uridine-5-carboxymethylaminomethyl(34) synthesis GTPase MnmE [Verrucomicrobiota bacterium]|nr:tRNA uridine-5-carboxymethylaminomethyl(34) synthesis GTPase MnmE [Verrucomicrobiota bacterium]
MNVPDTIVALSTPPGESAIALIRLSGPLCRELSHSITQRQSALKERIAHHCKYLDIKGKQLDECIFTYFSEGKSFTGDSMLEITPHGNPFIVHKILADLMDRGCRPAEPGEFTRTAFMNGRMDLSQAEAVSNLIRARSDRSLEAAQRQMNGCLGRKMNELTDRLLDVIAQIEAYIDFPEEDLPSEDKLGPASVLISLKNEICDLSETQRYSALLHDGIKTLIVGQPNVGKSSLINYLIGADRSIVSDLPGTTRDYISAFMMLGPWRIEILDTAGVHVSGNPIEKAGIANTIEQAQTADFFLFVLDASMPSPSLHQGLLQHMKPENTLVIENKNDLSNAREMSNFLPMFKHIRTSLKEGNGLDTMRNAWLESIDSSHSRIRNDGLVVNARHGKILTQVADALELAISKLERKEHPELIVADLRDAVERIGQIVGRVENDRMLDSLFKQFCIGK